MAIFFFLLIIIIASPVFWIVMMSRKSNARRNAREQAQRDLLAQFSLDDVITDAGTNFLGLRRSSRTIVTRTNIGLREFPYDMLRAASLTPKYETTSDTTGEQRTHRGSQLVGAAIGSAVAGPAGLIVGGLSGTKTTSTVTNSSEHLADLELELFIRSDELPRMVFHAGEVGAFGNRFVTYEQTESFKDMAARLASIVDAAQR